MQRTITIEPITRIEGHARVTLQLGEDGHVEDAHLHVTQVRGFEKLAEGRPFREMPSLTARICGICPVSHLLASAKACDELMAVDIPPTAVKLRKLLNYAQMVQSHALSYFYLSAPDLLLGMDAPQQVRNIAGLITTAPDIARLGIRLRQFGQDLIEQLGGKRIHNAWVIPGGVKEPLKPATREKTLGAIAEVKAIAIHTLEGFIDLLARYEQEIETFACFPTMYLGTVTANNTLEHYDGILRLVDENGKIVEVDIPHDKFYDYIGEATESFSYLKSPYYRPAGYPQGMYRVGPLARLQVAKTCGTPAADRALDQFREIPGSQRHSAFYYHYARLIELLHGIERIEELLNEPDILSTKVRAQAKPNRGEGVGIIEAPRGTLIHHYKADENGAMTDVNLIVATGHNIMAMNKGVKQVAQHFVRGDKLSEGALNRVEAVVRAFDPCLSCATHAIGQMPMHLQLLGADGTLLDEMRR
ncbi:MAG: Ni/Fe hydrogenase subunit alpha [Anaerolineae bacterium]|nr:Ni/Fe hydrogenase subunit alpha [Anaerolineae bacterium]MCA9888300.1 Ni/Fe hydrogenase subunit alpha [Anaerolineae bacterium]MCA9895324.1 Ni/Fe hydrogenase subunit alpha [Anaerolineae bacterium]